MTTGAANSSNNRLIAVYTEVFGWRAVDTGSGSGRYPVFFRGDVATAGLTAGPDAETKISGRPIPGRAGAGAALSATPAERAA